MDVRKRWQDRMAARTVPYRPDREAAQAHARLHWHPARYAGYYQDCEPLREFLQTPVDVNQYFREGGDGSTCLHMAVACEQAVELLLRAGADPNRPYLPLPLAKGDSQSDQETYLYSQAWAGNTPLHLAAQLGSPATVARLLEAGARITANDHGITPLDLCAGETLELLLRRVCARDLTLVRAACRRADYYRRAQAAIQLRDFLSQDLTVGQPP